MLIIIIIIQPTCRETLSLSLRRDEYERTLGTRLDHHHHHHLLLLLLLLRLRLRFSVTSITLKDLLRNRSLLVRDKKVMVCDL